VKVFDLRVWLGMLIGKTHLDWELLGDVTVPAAYRVVYLGLPEREKRKVERLYRKDVKAGNFGLDALRRRGGG